MKDGKVRKTHRAVDDEVLKIEDMFYVGDGLMMMPHDFENNPKECYGCRCSLKFYK